MAAHLDYDKDKRIIYLTTAPTGGTFVLNVQVDVYSDMKEDWRTNAALNKLKFPLSEPVGGNTIIPGSKYLAPYYFLKYGWTMRPYEADHTLYVTDGYLLLDGGGDPWRKTLGGYTVNVRDVVPSDATVNQIISGSGVTEQDKLDIANRVWIYNSRVLTSFGNLVSDIWSYGTRGLTTFGTLIADIWSYATRLLTGSGLTPSEQAELTGIKERTDNLPDNPADVSDIPTAQENALELLDNQTAP